jgi:predicted DsbA family dithiol-disulfide isomerase
LKLALDRDEAEALLSIDDDLEAMKDADALARRIRVEGVPFFVVNGTLTLSGAQQPDAFLETFRQAAGNEKTVHSDCT